MSQALAILPMLTSNGTFCIRRAGSSMDSFDTGNVAAGTTSLCVASGQLRNVFNYAANIAKQSKNAISADIVSAENKIKEMSNGSTFLKGAKNVAKFAGENINTIIIGGSVADVLLSDNKTDTAIENGVALSCMFAGEAVGKRVFGVPYAKKIDGENIFEKRDGLYSKNNGKETLIAQKGKYSIIDDGAKAVIERESILAKSPIVKKQMEAFNDACKASKYLKGLPKILVGSGFVLSSVLTYKGGKAISQPIKSLFHDEKQRA